jgi:hypothetical protein
VDKTEWQVKMKKEVIEKDGLRMNLVRQKAPFQMAEKL